MSASDELRALTSAHPLPAGWAPPSLVEDAYVADGLELHRAGLASTGPSGEEMVGSAADVSRSPLDRAYFELLERVTVVEAIERAPSHCETRTVEGPPLGRRPFAEIFPESHDPARWRYARSSGVAIHVDWRSASLRAFWELCERDRVLRSWYGEIAPRRVPGAMDDSPLAVAESYEWLACEFPASDASRFSRGVEVSGVFGLPRVAAPFVFGYGARPSWREALAAATREATQLLAFLWGEELPKAEPALSPTPLYHLETYQRPERLGTVRRWLEGAHARRAWPGRPTPGDAELCFADLTPGWLRGLSVSKAVCASALPLVFGEDPLGAHLPEEMRVHPIA
jgi:YcaO cyclodehydratase, ATP-ad Mg2+-binding